MAILFFNPFYPFLLRESALFCCGAAMLAALECIEDLEDDFVVMLFADRGEKYLSTNLFSP